MKIKKMKMRKKETKEQMNKLKITLLLIPILILSACVDNEKNKLENRVKDYWNFKISKNYKEAYNFLTPGYKKTESIEEYQLRLSSNKVNWLEYSLANKKCEQTDICTVNIDVVYEYYMPTAQHTKITVPSSISETWLMKDNVWYYFPKKKNIKQK